MKTSKTFASFRKILLIMPGLFLLYLIPVDLFSVLKNLLELLTGLLFIWWGLGIWKDHFPKPAHLSKWQRVAILSFLGVAFFSVVITVLSIEEARTVPLGILKGWFLAPAAYFIMLVSSFRKKQDVYELVDVSIGLVALSAALMLVQFFTGWFSDVAATADQRLVWPYLLNGKALSANYVGLFLSPFLCMAWVSFWKVPHRRDRLFYGLSIAVMALALYFSKSYGAWLSVIGACFLYSFCTNTGKRRWLIAPVVTALLLAGLYWDQGRSEKFQFALDLDGQQTMGSVEERLAIWQVSWDLIKEHIFLGIGPGQYEQQFDEQAPISLGPDTAAQIRHALHPHNSFLMFWISSGILGLLTFLFFLGVIAVPLNKDWRWLLWTPLLYLVAHSMIDVHYWKNDLSYVFWFLVGLSIIIQNQNLISAKVKHGLKVGRKLGFPTANINLDLNLDIQHGVHVVILKIENKKMRGLLYYGPRQTKGLPENMVCEITVLDFDGDLYSKKISFTIGKFIREPMEFSSPKKLKEQIEKDVLVARNIQD